MTSVNSSMKTGAMRAEVKVDKSTGPDIGHISDKLSSLISQLLADAVKTKNGAMPSHSQGIWAGDDGAGCVRPGPKCDLPGPFQRKSSDTDTDGVEITVPPGQPPSKAEKQVDLAARALSVFDGTGSKAFANNGQLGNTELKNAGITDKDFSKFLRFGVGSGDGQMSILDLALAQQGGLIEISPEGKISMTDLGKEQAAEWKKNPTRPEPSDAFKELDKSYQDAGKVFAHHDIMRCTPGGDGRLNASELKNAGITDPAQLKFILQVGAGNGQGESISAAKLAMLEHSGLVKVSKDGGLSMTERGQEVAKRWNASSHDGSPGKYPTTQGSTPPGHEKKSTDGVPGDLTANLERAQKAMEAVLKRCDSKD